MTNETEGGAARKPEKAERGEGIKPASSERMKPTNWFYALAWFLIGLFVRIVHPAKVEGLEKLPRHGALLCPNHASNWDPLIIAVYLPVNYRLHAMAKKELFENPVLRWILLKLGVFPVNREGTDVKAVKTAIQVLKDGDNLLIFPEGTTIRNGVGYVDGLPPHAKSGAAMIGIRTGAALIPVFVDGEKKNFHRTRLIFGDPYVPRYSGRRGTAEEMQTAADEMLIASYALGGQKVGGQPLEIDAGK